ncbi:MAG: carboxypeptidase regulatory-like domain-containing protein [Candidatus Cloacimonetes bacterium]|nr:carboxypeptidase regulatory-like domain-containing protein [Candidatus Cloacimonadota bacterium]
MKKLVVVLVIFCIIGAFAWSIDHDNVLKTGSADGSMQEKPGSYIEFQKIDFPDRTRETMRSRSLPWNNFRNCSYLSGNNIYTRCEVSDPVYSSDLQYFYLDNDTWYSSSLNNVFGNTYESMTAIDPYDTYYCRYRSDPASEQIKMMSAYLPNDNFPPNISELAFIDNDQTGDNLGGTYLDITSDHFGFSDTKFYGAITNNGGGYPQDSGGMFPSEYYLYISGFTNIAGAHSDSVKYGLVYGDIPLFYDQGLYRMIYDDYTRIGDIQTHIQGNNLIMSCNLTDLTSDPYFGDWNSDENTLENQSFTYIVYSPSGSSDEADHTDYTYQVIDNFDIPPFTNVLPEILDHEYSVEPSYTTFSATYYDADENFPITAELELTNPRDGLREIYQLEPDSYDFSGPVVFSVNLDCYTWSNGLFRFSDNNIDYITQVFMGPEEIFVEDFEYGTGNWTLDTRWGLTTSTYQSSNHCLCNPWMGGLYADNENSTATLDPFDFSACSNISVSFWETHDLELDHDYIYLEISTGGGWDTIASFTGLNSPWTKSSYSLSAYEGYSNVQIRFRLVSDFGFSYNGFFIDDFIINADGYPPFGIVSGEVTEDDGVTPIVGATIKAGNYGATTNSLGLYTINNVTPGNYNVVCGDSAHYSVIEYNQQVYEGATTTVDFSLEEVLSASNPAYLVFDGTGDYVDCGEGSGDFDITSAITLECFFMIDNDGWSNSYEALITKGDHTWRLARAGDSEHIEFACQDLTPNYYVTSNQNFIPEVWYHVAGVYDGSSLKLYVNGVLDNSVSAGGSIGSDNNPVYIGENYEYSRDFGGNIDEVRVWNTSLSQTTIENWMYEEITGSHPNYANLVSLWEMNDYGTPAVAYDSRGNNDGTINNAVYNHISECPVILVDPTSLSSNLAPDEIDDTQSFDISNIGDAGSNLTYDITWEYTTARISSDRPPVNPSLDRGVPHPVYAQIYTYSLNEDWLDLDPITGDCNSGETDLIDVEFNSARLSAGTYTAVISISNNAGADETIDVTLNVTASRDPYPASITFNAWIIGRESEVLTESSFGCGYWDVEGWLWVECGNFPTDWTNGDVLHIEAYEPATGHTATGEIILNWEAYQYMDDMHLSPEFPPDAPVNVTISEDGTNVTLNWDAVVGATSYTVYSDTDPYGDFLTEEESGITETTWNELLSSAGDMKFYRVTAANTGRNRK